MNDGRLRQHVTIFYLWDHDGCVRVRRYAGQRCFSECVIERHSGRTPRILVRGEITCHGRSNFLRIEGNLNSSRYVSEVLKLEVLPFLPQGIPRAFFQLDNARPHIEKTAKNFFSVQHMQLLPLSSYSPDMSPIEQVCDLVGRRLTRHSRPAASGDELLLTIQAIWNCLPQADIQDLFDFLPCRLTPCHVVALIPAVDGYTKY